MEVIFGTNGKSTMADREGAEGKIHVTSWVIDSTSIKRLMNKKFSAESGLRASRQIVSSEQR
jgi:hypothetical protein